MGAEQSIAKRHPRALAVLALGAAIVAFAWPIQEVGWSQKAHYALVRSLADGTPRIDAYHRDTGDKAYFEGHFYSVKAPGLAIASLPSYLALDGLGLLPESPRTAIWLLNLFSVVPLALALCAVTGLLARRLTGEPGWGVAVALGGATLVLPFAGLYYAHVPAALFGVAAVVLALRARERGSPATAALAGAAGGLGVLFEYPTAVVVAAAALLVTLGARGRLRALGALAGGAFLTGGLPILLYNAWAFGSPTHVSYGNLVEPSDWQSDTPALLGQEAFGFARPSFVGLVDILLSERGLFVTTPLVVAGAAGLILLLRERRLEAWTLGGAIGLTVLWDSGYTDAYGGVFGGDTPGPRYLIAVLPLLLAALTLASRRAPGAIAALAAISFGFMTVVTVTRPQVGPEETGIWWDGLVDGQLTQTPLTHAGAGSGWVSSLPFIIAAAAIGLSYVRFGVGPLPRSSLLAGGASLVAWAVVATTAPMLLRSPGGVAGGALALLMLLVAAMTVVWSCRPARTRRRPPASASAVGG